MMLHNLNTYNTSMYVYIENCTHTGLARLHTPKSSRNGRLCRCFCVRRFCVGNLTTTGRGMGRTPPVALSNDQVRCCIEMSTKNPKKKRKSPCNGWYKPSKMGCL